MLEDGCIKWLACCKMQWRIAHFVYIRRMPQGSHCAFCVHQQIAQLVVWFASSQCLENTQFWVPCTNSLLSINPFLLRPNTASLNPSSLFLEHLCPGYAVIGIRKCTVALIPAKTVICDLWEAVRLYRYFAPCRPNTWHVIGHGQKAESSALYNLDGSLSNSESSKLDVMNASNSSNHFAMLSGFVTALSFPWWS